MVCLIGCVDGRSHSHCVSDSQHVDSGKPVSDLKIRLNEGAQDISGRYHLLGIPGCVCQTSHTIIQVKDVTMSPL